MQINWNTFYKSSKKIRLEPIQDSCDSMTDVFLFVIWNRTEKMMNNQQFFDTSNVAEAVNLLAMQ